MNSNQFNILAIVDDEINAFLLSKLLSEFKIQIVTSLDKLSAFPRTMPVSLVIMDLVQVYSSDELLTVLSSVKNIF